MKFTSRKPLAAAAVAVAVVLAAAAAATAGTVFTFGATPESAPFRVLDTDGTGGPDSFCVESIALAEGVDADDDGRPDRVFTCSPAVAAPVSLFTCGTLPDGTVGAGCAGKPAGTVVTLAEAVAATR